jgi:hypothetical protein
MAIVIGSILWRCGGKCGRALRARHAAALIRAIARARSAAVAMSPH